MAISDTKLLSLGGDYQHEVENIPFDDFPLSAGRGDTSEEARIIKSEIGGYVKLYDNASVDKRSSESNNFLEIENTIRSNFQEIADQVGGTLHVFSGDEMSRAEIISSAIHRKLSKEFKAAWGIPPYNEAFIHKDALNSEDPFDPPEILKKGRGRLSSEMGDYYTRLWKGKDLSNTVVEPNLLDPNEWVEFWSANRVIDYIDSCRKNDDYYLGVLLDGDGDIMFWTQGFTTDPFNKIGKDVFTEKGERINKCMYFDTIGYGVKYRSADRQSEERNLKKQITYKLAATMSGLSSIANGNSLIRTIHSDRAIAAFSSALGYQNTNEQAEEDDERVFWLSTRNGENNFILKDRPVNRIVQKVSNYTSKAIESRLANEKLTQSQLTDLESLTVLIENGELSKNVLRQFWKVESLTDITDKLIVPTAMVGMVATHVYILQNYPLASLPLAALESIPVLGGLSAFYRTIYLIGTLTVPEIIAAKSMGDSVEFKNLFVRTFGSTWDGGWVILPLLRDPKNYLLVETILKQVKNDVFQWFIKYLPDSKMNIYNEQ